MIRAILAVFFTTVGLIGYLFYLAFVQELVWAAFLCGILVTIFIVWITHLIDMINDWLASRAANQHMQSANQNMLNQQVGMMSKIASGYGNLLLAEDRAKKIEGQGQQQIPAFLDEDDDLPIEGL